MPDNFIPQPSQNTPQTGDLRRIPDLYVAPINTEQQNKPVNNKPLSWDEIISNSSKTTLQDPQFQNSKFLNPVITTPFSISERYSDSELGFDALDPNLEQKYADKQSWLKRIGNRVAKTGAIALTSFVDNFISIANDIKNNYFGKSSSNSIIDNLQGWTERLDRVYLPNYQTQYQKENPVLSYFTPWNFTSWIDNVGSIGQNLGFTLGSVASAMVVDIPVGALTKGVGDFILLPKQLERIHKGLGTFSKIISRGGKEFEEFKALASLSDDVVKGITSALNKMSNYKTATDLVRFGINTGVSAYGESILEGNQVYRDVKKDLMSSNLDEFGNFKGSVDERNNIENQAKLAGKATVGPNFAFLLVSNAIGLQSILRPAESAIRATEEAIGKKLALEIDPNNLNKIIVKETGNKFKNIAGKVFYLTKGNAREAIEEGYQFVVSDYNKNYYERKFNSQSNDEVFSLTESIGNLFSTTDGQLNMLAGFLGGGLQHVIKSGYNRMILGESNSKFAENLKSNLNKFTATSINNVSKNEAVTANSIEKDLEASANNKDIFAYKNLQYESLFNFVYSGLKANKFDLRIDQLQQLKDLKEEDFKTYWGIDLTHTNKENTNAYIDSIITKANEIKNISESVDKAFGKNPFSKKDNDNYDAFETYKQELTISLSKLNNFKDRVTSLENTISQKLPGASVDDVSKLASEKGIKETIESFSKKIEELKNSENLSIDNQQLSKTYKEERNFLERRLKELNTALDTNYNNKDFLGTINAIHNYYANTNSLRNGFTVNQLESFNIFANSADTVKLKNEIDNSLEYYKTLSKKEGFNIFKSKLDLARRNYEESIEIDDNGHIRFKTQDEKEQDISEKEDKKIEELKKELDIETVEEGIEEIKEKKNKKKTAKLLNPNYENEPDSKEFKIVNDPIAEFTEEDVDTALERLNEDFNVVNKKTKKKKKFDENDINADPFDAETAEGRKQLAIIKQLEAEDSPTTVNSSQNKEIDSEYNSPDNIVKRFWSNYILRPYVYLNRVWSPSNSKNKEYVNFKNNLRKVLFSTSTVKEVNDNILSKINITIKNSDKGLSQNKYTKIHYYTDDKQKVTIENVYRKGNSKDIIVNIGDTQIGLLQGKLYFKRNDDYIPLHEVTEKEYEDITKNKQSSYNQFIAETKAYDTMYDKIISKDNWSNSELLEIVKPVISYGGFASSNNFETSTLISKMEYRNPNDVILSFPIIENENGQLERQSIPVILNKKGMSSEQILEINEFLEKEKVKNKLKGLDSRYIYLARTPDGTLSENISVLAARPSNETEDNTQSFLDKLKNAASSANSDNIIELNDSIKKQLYISHTKENSQRTTNIKFVVEENGDITLDMYNKKLKRKASVTLNKEDVINSDSFNILLTKFQDKIIEKQRIDGKYSDIVKLDIKLKNSSFKKYVEDDENINSIKNVENKISVSVYPQVWDNPSITLLPNTNNESVFLKTPESQQTTEHIYESKDTGKKYKVTEQGKTQKGQKRIVAFEEVKEPQTKVETLPITKEQVVSEGSVIVEGEELKQTPTDVSDEPNNEIQKAYDDAKAKHSNLSENIKEEDKSIVFHNIEEIKNEGPKLYGDIVDANFPSIIKQLENKNAILRKDC